MKYKIEITETLQRIIEVEADNVNNAISIVNDMYRDEVIILRDSDYIDSKIEVIEQNRCLLYRNNFL